MTHQKDSVLTYWPKLNNPIMASYVTLEHVLECIRVGIVHLDNFPQKTSDLIDEIRSWAKEPDTKENRHTKNNLKLKLPGVSFAGKFSKRANDSLMESSGYMCLDIDKTLDVPEKLRKHAVAVWLSPSGNGHKVLLRIPLVKDDHQYKQFFAAIEKQFPQVDRSGKDVSRLTYFSYDPDIVINYQAPLWTERLDIGPSTTPPKVEVTDLLMDVPEPAAAQTPVPVPVVPAIPTRRRQPGGLKNTSSAPASAAPSAGPLGQHRVQSNYAKFIIPLKMIQQCQVGNRHETILKAGKLVGGYIAGGEVNEEDVARVFAAEIKEKMDHPDDFPKQWDTFMDGIGYGKALPIAGRESERKKLKAEFKAEVVFGDLYTTASDANEELDELYENGYTRGMTTGWSAFDRYYSVPLGFYSILYGAPATGKSKWLFALLVNLSKLHGCIHCIFSPETGTARDIYAAIIQIVGGGDITDTYNNKMPRHVYDEAKKFVDTHFLVIDTEMTGIDFNLGEYLTYVSIIEKKLGIKFHTVTGDPLIEFKQDYELRDDQYWNDQLKVARIESKQNNWHVFLVNHVIKLPRIGQDEFGTAIYPIPTMQEMNGGQVFSRKGFQIISFYRHWLTEENQLTLLKPLGNKEVWWNSLFLRIQKSKPEGVGKLGEIEFRLDVKRHVYSDPLGEMKQQAAVAKVEATASTYRKPYSDNDNMDDTPNWAKS